MHKTKKINIMVTKEAQIYNQFNDSQLSNELSIYILEQFKGIPFKTEVILNICPNYKMVESEKRKLVDKIRENYGLDIRENLLILKSQRLKDLIMLLIGISLIAIEHLLVAEYFYNLQQFLSILGWFFIYECFKYLSFVNTKLRYQNKRYNKLIKSKIIFTEPVDDNLEKN